MNIFKSINGDVFSGFILFLNYLLRLRQIVVGRFSLTHAFFEQGWISIVWLLLTGFIDVLKDENELRS